MRHVLLGTALLALSLVQCSSSEKKVTKYPDGTSFCTGWAEAECTSSVVNTCLATSKDVCVASRQSVCAANVLAPATSAGLNYNSGQAEECVKAISTAYSDAKITSAEEAAMVQACGLVFSGSGTKGSNCAADSDCQQGGGLRCVMRLASTAGDAGEVEGPCQVPTPVSAGLSCSAPEAQCATDFYCDSNAHCVAAQTLTQNCSAQMPCVSNAKCSAGTCIAKQGQGTACTSDDDCASGYCVEGKDLCAETYQLASSEPFCSPMHD
jgi:hypothetical protein